MTLSDRSVSRLQQLVSPAPVPPARYTLHEVLGQGGMGVVYRAHDVQLRRDVAFKVLDERAALNPQASERLHREASILAGLEHPGIVPVHDVGELENGNTFYVMQLVRGERLDHHVRLGVGRGDVLRLMLRLCETVAFANAQGVIHRDLKPGNIMIGPFGEVLLLDWGVARLLSEVRDGATVVGTPGYMSPEQQTGASVDQTADVYALGVIMRELLAHANEPSTRPLDAIVKRATAAAREHRYGSAIALADDIRRWLDGQSVAVYQETTVEKLMRAYRQHQTAVLLVLTYLVVRSVILLWRHI